MLYKSFALPSQLLLRKKAARTKANTQKTIAKRKHEKRRNNFQIKFHTYSSNGKINIFLNFISNTL